MMKLCRRHNIHLIADEIYALSVYKTPSVRYNVKFASVLSFDSNDYIAPECLHVLYGMSKDFGASGLRLGCIHTKSRDVMNAMNALAWFGWTAGPEWQLQPPYWKIRSGWTD